MRCRLFVFAAAPGLPEVPGHVACAARRARPAHGHRSAGNGESAKDATLSARGKPGPARSGVGRLLRLQSAYYCLTGVWPLVHMRSFEAVTGPKTDDWLVRMVALLTVAIAGAIWPRGSADAVAAQTRMLAVTAAASYLVIDVFYAATGVISPIYLLDAVLEIALLVAHALVWSGERSAGR